MSAESTANQQEPVEIRKASAAKSAEQAKSSRKQKKQRFYKRFKIVFSREGYLDSVPCYKLRKLVSKFRCSDHKLEIEVGRRKNVLADQRTCNICMNGVECEVHFLTECPLYNGLRLKYFGENVQRDLIKIMKCSDKAASFNLANYLDKAYSLREHCLRMRSYFYYMFIFCVMYYDRA